MEVEDLDKRVVPYTYADVEDVKYDQNHQQLIESRFHSRLSEEKRISLVSEFEEQANDFIIT